jgi:hypothetical protein
MQERDMDKQYGPNRRVARSGCSISDWNVLTCIGVLATVLCVSTPAAAQFNSGSTGIHGPFPPVPAGGTVPNSAYVVWNVRTGSVRYCSVYTLESGSDQCNTGSATNVSAQIPNIPPGGLLTGVYEFTSVDLTTVFGIHRNVVIVGRSPNVPLTILSQGDITLTGEANGYQVNILANGHDAPNHDSNFAVVGASGGPGGFDGGGSGNGGATPGNGAAGFGPVGGAAGQANAAAASGLNGAHGAASPLNPSLTPLSGGSGGGGAAGVAANNVYGCSTPILGHAGGGGGGGGGAILLAASGRVTVGGFTSINVTGGNGGRNNSSSCVLSGGGGAGGSVRIVAQEFAGNGTIAVSGGSGQGIGVAPGGQVRIEASLNSFTGNITGALGGSFIGFPTAAVPANQPVLRIASIAGTSAPANPGASLAAPDITFQSAIESPVTLAVSANNVPLGTPVNIRVVPATGQPTTATSSGLTGSFASSTAQATVTLPPGAGVVTASATFQVGGSGGVALNSLPLIDGKRPEKVEVAVLADGSSRTYLVSQSGIRFEVAMASR